MKIKAPGLTPSSEYVLPWTFRSSALSRLGAAGVTRVTGWGKLSVQELHDAFPDQGQWLTKLREHVRTTRYRGLEGTKPKFSSLTVANVLKWLEFTLPAELLSMCLCFAGDHQLRFLTASRLGELSGEIKAKSEEYDATHGQWPHLVVAAGLLQTAPAK